MHALSRIQASPGDPRTLGAHALNAHRLVDASPGEASAAPAGTMALTDRKESRRTLPETAENAEDALSLSYL